MTAPKQEVPGKDFDPEPPEEEGAASAPASRAVATVEEPAAEGKLAVGDLPPELRASLQSARIANAVAAEVAKLSWGQSLSGPTTRAIVQWGRDHDVDVVTEIDILGGRPYLNHRFYLRKLARLIDAGRVEYAVADHIEADPRLADLAAKGNTAAGQESERRQMQRITHQVPETAVAAVVFRVKLRAMREEVTGCKWAGGRGKNHNGKLNDPIGEQFPVETAESRAARRCIRHLVGHVPELEATVGRVEAAAVELEPLIDEDRATLKAQGEEHRKALGHGIDEARAAREYGGGEA